MKILFFANTRWYLYNFRLALARYLRDQGHEVVMFSPPGPARLQAAGFPRSHYPDAAAQHSTSCVNLPFSTQSARFMLRNIPDLAHHFTLKCVVCGGLAARLTGGIARIHAVTGLGHVFTSDSVTARFASVPGGAGLLLAPWRRRTVV